MKDIITARVNNKLKTQSMTLEMIAEQVRQEAEFELSNLVRFNFQDFLKDVMDQMLEEDPECWRFWSPSRIDAEVAKDELISLDPHNILLHDVRVQNEEIQLFSYLNPKKVYSIYELRDGMLERTRGRMLSLRTLTTLTKTGLSKDWLERYKLMPEAYQQQYPICLKCGQNMMKYQDGFLCINPKCR